MAHAQRRPSSPLRSEALDRAKNQEKYPRRSGRNTRSAAASGSRFLPRNALEASEHHKQANMEGTVPTEATGDKNGRGVELANQTGVGKPSSSGDNSDGGVNRDVQRDAGTDFSSSNSNTSKNDGGENDGSEIGRKNDGNGNDGDGNDGNETTFEDAGNSGNSDGKRQSNGSDMRSKVLEPRMRDLGTIIDKDGKTYKVRKMVALLLLLKHPGLPWKTGGEAANAIFSSGRHCINKHNKYWKEKMSENYDGIVLVGEFFLTLLQSCGYLDGGLTKSEQEIDLVNALPLPDEGLGKQQQAIKLSSMILKKLKGCSYQKAAELASRRCKLASPISRRQVEYYNISGGSVPRKVGRKRKIEHFFEEHIAELFRMLVEQKFTLYRPMMLQIINGHLKILGADSPFPKGVNSRWLTCFCKEYEIALKPGRPCDARRNEWCTAENLFQSFENLANKLVQTGIANKNPNWKSPQESRGIERVFLKQSECWRLWEFDETKFKIGADKMAKKGNRERVCTDKRTGDNEILVDSKSEHGVSGMLTVRGDGYTMKPGFCFDQGDNASIARYYSTGKPEHDSLWKMPMMMPDATTKEIEPFYTTNEKGSFDSNALIGYLIECLDTLDEKHQPTKERPIVLYVDGVQTHVGRPLVDFCLKKNIEIILKCPYASHLLQSMDIVGGHFALIKPEFRMNLNKTMNAKRVYILEAMRKKQPISKLKLDLYDFVPCLKEPWEKNTGRTKNLHCFEKIGVIPFTMLPAYTRFDEETKNQTKEIQRGHLKRKYNAAIGQSPKVLKEVLLMVKPMKIPPKDKPAASLEEYIEYINSGKTKEQVGIQAALKSIDNNAELSEEEGKRLKAIMRKSGWGISRASGVFNDFDGCPTGRLRRAADKAIDHSLEAQDLHIKAKVRMKRDKDKKEATKERVIAKAVVDYLENAKYSKQAVSDLPKKFKKEQIRSFYRHFCGGKESNVSRSKMKTFSNIILVDKIELSKYVRDKRNETSIKRQMPHTETI